MAERQRFQSIVLGDTVNLDLNVFQNNSNEDLYDIQKIEIYFEDPTQVNCDNPDGRMLKKIINTNDIYSISQGHYRTQLFLEDSLYEVGNYIDIWYVKYNAYETEFTKVENKFKVITDLWQTFGYPFVYDVTFSFKPKKIQIGSKKYLTISYFPNVTNSDIFKHFYFNIQTNNSLYIRIEQIEGCGYDSKYDLANIKTNPEWAQAELYGDNLAYYMIDCTETTKLYDIGVYTVQFKILIDEQEILSPKYYLQIWD